VQLSEIDTMFVALSVGRFAVLADWLADALDDDGLPIEDDDGDCDDGDEDDCPSGCVELDGLVEDELGDELGLVDEPEGLAPIAPAPPAGAAATEPVTVTL
jgi:hypothetical protein